LRGRDLLALLATVLLLGGCAGVGRAVRSGPPVPSWQIAPEDLASQRLFRAGYAGPEGEASFRLTLKLFSAGRYLAQAVDPLGRALWSLDVDGDHGIWVDHRARTFCAFTGEFPAVGREIGAFPLPTVPALLLGRTPAVPAHPEAIDPAAAGLDFRDASGRRWTVQQAGGQVATWTLWEGDAPALWWMRKDSWAILSQRQRGIQVRWKEVVREPLAERPGPVQSPTDYRRGTCDDAPVGLLPGSAEGGPPAAAPPSR